MTSNYYSLMINAYEDAAGSIDSPNCDFYPKRLDRDDINISDEFIYELNDGMFCHFHMAPHGINLVDSILKDLLEKFAEKEFVEFIPVMIKSKEYGDKQYFTVHFKKTYDVIDFVNSYCDPPGCVIRMCVDYNKVKNLHVFNSAQSPNIIVSTKVYKEIKKRKLNFGLSFGIIRCLNK